MIHKLIVRLLTPIACSYLIMSCTSNPIPDQSKATSLSTDTIKKQEPIVDKNEEIFLTHICSPKDVEMFWKAEDGHIFKNFDSLDTWLKVKHQKQLLFAMNGGIYMEDNSPLGLYIENGKTLRKLNTRKGAGNFYMQPNGVFFIDNNEKAYIVETSKFNNHNNIKYASQSGPIVLLNGVINSTLNKGSANINIRNGVGILPNGDCLFVMSRGFVNFYDFANFFKENGCKTALYFDGAISQTYLPAKAYNNKGGNFGVIIGQTEALKK